MKFSRTDLPLMRKSVSIACASALFCIATVYGSSQYSEHVREQRHGAQRLLGEAHSKLAVARQNTENRLFYSGEYAALESQGIIGDEERLDWMEEFEKLREQNLVSDFRYQISPQKNHAAIPEAESGNFNVRYSEMKLQFDLLHEAQLLAFFDALRSQFKGRYQLESCLLQRIVDTNGSPRLKAECSGGWVTLKNRRARP